MPAVNVNDDGDTVAWPVVPDDTSITTVPEDGSESRTTVNVAVLLPPAASVTVTDDVDFVKPAWGSSSTVVAVTVWLATPSYATSLVLPSVIARVIVESMSPSSSPSSTPVTVIVWAELQLPVVNVNDDADTVASPVSPDVTPMTTLPTGFESSTTVNVSVVPDSFTDVAAGEPVWVTVNPGMLKQFIPSPCLRLSSPSTTPDAVAVPLPMLIELGSTFQIDWSPDPAFFAWKYSSPSIYQAARQFLPAGIVALGVRCVTAAVPEYWITVIFAGLLLRIPTT